MTGLEKDMIKDLEEAFGKNINDILTDPDPLSRMMNIPNELSDLEVIMKLPTIEEFMALDEFDKTYWGDGDWQNEPDRLLFDYLGYTCLIVRNNGGALCGYVALQKEDPIVKDKHYDDIDIDVYEGLTFKGSRDSFLTDEERENLDSENLTWIGFDCAHLNDHSPKTELILKMSGERAMEEGHEWAKNLYEERKLERETNKRWGCPYSYKNIEFVKKELESMVDQIIDLKK